MLRRLNDEFEKFFKENSANPAAAYKTYVIKAENNPDKIKKMTDWLTTHSIQFGHVGAGKAAHGFDFSTQGQNNFNLTTEDIIFNIYQPKGRFITTVFEPQSKLNDSLTYDITAWNLFYSYGLKAFALNEKIAGTKNYQPAPTTSSAIPDKPYAYVFRYQSLNDAELLAALMKKGMKVRASEKTFTLTGQSFDPEHSS